MGRRALRHGDAARLGELTRADLRTAGQRTGGGDVKSAADEPELPAPDRPGERIELRPDGDVWRRRYRDEPAGVAIPSNRAVLTEQEAVDSARLAYSIGAVSPATTQVPGPFPGVDHVTVPGPPPPPPPGWVRTALRRWGNAALGVSLLAAALRQRRDRRRGGDGNGPERR